MMKPFRWFLLGLAGLSLLPLGAARAAEAYAFTTHIYLFRSADVPAAPVVEGAAAAGARTGQWSVFVSPVTLKFGDETLAIAGPDFTWNQASGQPSNFNLVSSPAATAAADQAAKVTIGQTTQYFEKLPDGNFRLHEVSAGSAEAAHCDVVFSARPADGAGESLLVTCRPEIATVRDRQAIPGVNLDVGKPVLASFADELKFTATPGEWSCLFSRSAGGGDYGLLILVKATPKTLPTLPAPVVRTVPAYLVVDVTDQGKKVPPASADHPAYYFPAVVGYHDLGELKPGEVTPPVEAIDHLLAEALFARGYRVMSKKSGPSLVLSFAWGYLAPSDDATAGSRRPQSRMEYNVMQVMIDGDEGVWASPKAKGYKAAIQSDRYYVFVSAFDAADALKHHATLLWHARISTAAKGITLREALPSLIAAAGPAFGRATPPVAFDIPVVGGDELGSAVVAISQIQAPASTVNPNVPIYDDVLNQSFGAYEFAERNNSTDGASPVVSVLQGQNNTLAPNQR